MPASKRTRFEVFKRDRFTCQYCGRTPPAVKLEADHIHPESKGGPDTADNLVTSCEDCNRGKSDRLLTEAPRALAEVMTEAAEKREQLEAYGEFLAELKRAEDERIERLAVYWLDKLLTPRRRGKYTFADQGRRTTLRTFLRRMPEPLIVEAMDIAESRMSAEFRGDERRWRYFCGVCWKKIREAEGEA